MKHYKHIGEKFGRLTVLEKVGTAKNGRAIVKCLCECGIIKEFVFDNISRHDRGGTSSCGCLHKEIVSSKDHWQSELNKYLGNTVKRRDLSFNLSVEEFQQLCSSSCFYCGAPPSTKMHVKHGGFRNGIDRIDSSIGYEPTNVVPCCRICNDTFTRSILAYH